MSIFKPHHLAARPLGDDAGTPFVSAPWMQANASTSSLQNTLNPLLYSAGYCALTVDGILGPATCGAARTLGLTPPTACQSYTAPSLITAGCPAPKPPAAAPAAKKVTTIAPVVLAQPKPASASMLLVGGFVLLAAGGAYYIAKKKGMV